MVFSKAKGEFLHTDDGVSYLDFLAGAGSLNYGHNPEPIKCRLIEHLESDGLTHGLDLATTAKAAFLDALYRHVLTPRGLDYKVQFCSPSGTNAVEAALKLARVATGRTGVVAFSGAFHGVSLGSLAATSSGFYRQGVQSSLGNVTHVPYPSSPLGAFDTLDLLGRIIDDPSSGTEKPAAILIETVQCEGGVYLAPTEFLVGLRELCDRHKILLIVDEIQTGCGRTGTFFSFERSGIQPDLVPLAKSISGYGLPMAMLLIRPDLDVWQPGQHNGTFRGNQLAFVGAAAALDLFWRDDIFAQEVRQKGELVGGYLEREVALRFGARVRGSGLIWGIDIGELPSITAGKLSRLCFERGMVVETCGRTGDVLKLLPPLTISEANLMRGLDIVVEALYDLAGQ